MNPVQFTGSTLTAALSAANDMATGVAGTVSGNSGWLILIATAGILMFLVTTIIASLSRLGRGGTDVLPNNFSLQRTYMAEIERKAYDLGRKGDKMMDDVPLSTIDRKEHLRVKALGLDK